MGRRTLKEKNIRKLTRVGRGGGSLGLTIPIEIVRSLKWRERQKVVVKKIGSKIIISDWKK
jgi:antitoxin component of MazEF toxin-antitoxin module